MKTNHNGHTLRNLTNRVMAVIDDAQHAQAAVETLERAGVPERELAALSGTEGAREIDADGAHSGGVKHALRALQRLTVEGASPPTVRGGARQRAPRRRCRLCTDAGSVTPSFRFSAAMARISSTPTGSGPSRALPPDEGVTCEC